MITIDGSHGEGGGQIIRTAIALSMIQRQPVEIQNIRARRPKPGLSHQHLACVKAAASICSAHVEGAELGAGRLVFTPNEIMPGRYSFDIRTAGSVSLVLQTLLIPLALGREISYITISGGTHVPWSPSIHYLNLVFRPVLLHMGVKFTLVLKKWGWYPKGGGVVVVTVYPAKGLGQFSALNCNIEKTEGITARAISAISNLPRHVLQRQSQRIRDIFDKERISVELEEIETEAYCPGSIAFCYLAGSGRHGGYSGLGERGKPAEIVAEEAAKGLLGFIRSGASVDEHLADQLLLPSVLAEGESAWTVSAQTPHLATNAWVTERFGVGSIEFYEDKSGLIVVKVAGSKGA